MAAEAQNFPATNIGDHDLSVFTPGGGTVACTNVPKPFVPPLRNVQANSETKQTTEGKTKRKRSRGWSAEDLALLEEAKTARARALREGRTASQANAFIRDYLKEKGVEKR